MPETCTPIDVFEFASTADKPFEMDWTGYLAGAILVSVVWSASNPALLEFHDDTIEDAGVTARVWVRGRDAGSGQVRVIASIVASDGRRDAAEWRFDVCVP